MRIIHQSCAGLDVHKKTIVACSRILEPDGREDIQVLTFGTMTADLLDLADWLALRGVTHVAMESTGVYWKPVFHLLEGHFDVMLVNAHHLKNVPGRKTDVKDAEWISELLQHGMLKPSFIPPPPIRELRDLTRQRTVLIRDRAAVVNRVQKLLEDANIKLAAVATDVMGVSGRAMIREIIAGQSDAETLAQQARARLRKKLPQLRRALEGRVTEHHRFQLRLLMDQIDSLEKWIAELGGRIEGLIPPFAEAAELLRQIPGVGPQAAEVIVAEIGTDMEKFPTAGHLASWAGMCPGNHETAGKRKSGKTTKGSQWLRTTLVQSAWAASHTKATIFASAYKRWVKRLGKKKALVAVAHKVLVVAYMLLKRGIEYREMEIKPKTA